MNKFEKEAFNRELDILISVVSNRLESEDVKEDRMLSYFYETRKNELIHIKRLFNLLSEDKNDRT